MKILTKTNILLTLLIMSVIKKANNSKLLNMTEITSCGSTPNPTSKEDCLSQNFTSIVCCFYKMTFPIETNICNGASKSSVGLKSEDKQIKLKGEIYIGGSLDCKANFYSLGGLILFIFSLFLLI